MQKREPRLEDRYVPLRELEEGDVEMADQVTGAAERYQICVMPQMNKAQKPMSTAQEVAAKSQLSLLEGLNPEPTRILKYSEDQDCYRKLGVEEFVKDEA